MIFYFTGTGNSQYAAHKLANSNEAVIRISDCIEENRYDFSIAENEPLGIVFPVYFGGLPSVLAEFLDKMNLIGKPAYTYTVITCGSDVYGAGTMLSECLAKHDISLQAVYPLVMPSNYIVMFDIKPADEEAVILQNAETALEDIKAAIQSCKETPLSSGKAADEMTAKMYPLYDASRTTKDFWTDDSCVGCGVCAERCPTNAIEMVDGKVTWVKDRCAHCMACARCGAIQYGKDTVNRKRYTHPMLRKKKCCETT